MGRCSKAERRLPHRFLLHLQRPFALPAHLLAGGVGDFRLPAIGWVYVLSVPALSDGKAFASNQSGKVSVWVTDFVVTCV